MNAKQYQQIVQKIYENGRVESADDGDDSASFDAEFHFEAKEQGFTDAEISSARKRFDNGGADAEAFARNPYPGGF